MERNMSIERMEYQNNKISYNLGLIAFLLDGYYLTVSLNNIEMSLNVGIEVMFNLLMFLILLLGLEKVKNYSKTWSFIIMFIGVSYILRIFWIPLILRESGKTLASNQSIMALLVGGILLLISGYIGYHKVKKIENYLNKLGEV